MSFVVDSCVLLDIALKDPKWSLKSATMLEKKMKHGLVVCPLSVIEISPQFAGSLSEVRSFLRIVGVDYAEPWNDTDTSNAAKAWSQYVSKRRSDKVAKRPLADILIGAFALRLSGLITRNPEHFKPWFPTIKILDPKNVNSTHEI